MKETISSTSNPRIKALLKLQEKSSERRAQGLFVAEGLREIRMALEAGIHIKQLFICPERLPDAFDVSAMGVDEEKSFLLSPHVFEKLAYRGESGGMIALMATPMRELEKFEPPGDAVIVILEAIEKPGNLGAVLRTADAAGVSAVVVCDPLTDPYNPNVIRASIGCIFTVPVFVADSEAVHQWLRKRKFSVYAAALQESVSLFQQSIRGPVAWVMGTEAHGLSPYWRKAADQIISIPMMGKADSLNVAASVAVLVFETFRQRWSAGD